MQKTVQKNNNNNNKGSDKKNETTKTKTIKLSIYFSILISSDIVIVSLLFTLYTVFNIKNLASSFESDIYKLR